MQRPEFESSLNPVGSVSFTTAADKTKQEHLEQKRQIHSSKHKSHFMQESAMKRCYVSTLEGFMLWFMLCTLHKCTWWKHWFTFYSQWNKYLYLPLCSALSKGMKNFIMSVLKWPWLNNMPQTFGRISLRVGNINRDQQAKQIQENEAHWQRRLFSGANVLHGGAGFAFNGTNTTRESFACLQEKPRDW